LLERYRSVLIAIEDAAKANSPVENLSRNAEKDFDNTYDEINHKELF